MPAKPATTLQLSWISWPAVIVALVILVSRAPFLDAGYGVNADAWRVAHIARLLGQTGVYEVSRFPGYPVHEIVSSWFWKGGPIALNALSAVMSLIACLAAWQIARRLQCRDALLLAAALAATPVFYVSSVTTKDYIWGLAFAWLAICLALENKPLLAGFFLGMAVGCRITSGAMFLPLALILFGANLGAARARAVGSAAIVSALTAAACFRPVWQRYGWGFFTFYDSHGRPDIATLALRGTAEVWGALGLLGLVLALAAMLLHFRVRRPTSIPPAANRMIFPAFLLIIAIYLAAYLRLPDQAGYLLPVVPATLFLLARYAPRRAFQICCVLLLVSPFLELNSHGFQPGAILTDRRERQKTISDVTRFIQFTEAELPDENLVIVGGWEPMITVLAPAGTVRNHYAYLATETEVRQARSAGWGLAYTGPAIRQFNYDVKGVDLAEFSALDLREVLRAKRH